MSWWDRAFSCIKGQTYVYNLSWEDPVEDHRLINIEAKDACLTLCSGGDNALDYMIARPKKIVVVDLNEYQLALLDLKLASIKTLKYEEAFALWATSSKQVFDRYYVKTIRPALRRETSRKFWDANGSSTFNDKSGFVYSGTSGWFAYVFVKYVLPLTGLAELVGYVQRHDLLGLRQWWSQPDTQSRVDRLCRMLTNKFFLKLYLLTAAVPPEQLALLKGGQLTDWVKGLLSYLVNQTDLVNSNYFYYGYLTGHWTATNCPRWLQAQHFATLKAHLSEHTDACDLVHGTLADAVGAYPENFFTKISLLDHCDWMPSEIALDEWERLRAHLALRSPATRILWRSFAAKGGALAGVPHYPASTYAWFDSDCHTPATAPDRVGMYNTTWVAKPSERFEPMPWPDSTASSWLANTASLSSASTADATTERQGFWSRLKQAGSALSARFAATTSIVKEAACSAFRLRTTAQHAEKIEGFYKTQAQQYDALRGKMLHGREGLLRALPLPVGRGTTWLDVGAGTGHNLERLRHVWDRLSCVVLADISPSLLEVARQKIAQWGPEMASKVVLLLVDFTAADAADKCLALLRSNMGEDCPGFDWVTFSYSLSMIPDWRGALDTASALCRPNGGVLGVTDFTVPEQEQGVALLHAAQEAGSAVKKPLPKMSLRAKLIQLCYSLTHVHVRPEIIPELVAVRQSRWQPRYLEMEEGAWPWVPKSLWSVPYFVYVGVRNGGETTA